MSNVKLQKKELEILKGYQQKTNDTIVSLGTIELRKIQLEEQKEKIIEGFKNLQIEQEETALELQEKYGEGNINLELGEFTPSK